MKNSKLRVGLAAVILLFAVSLITSCGKTDVSDGDEVGAFSLTIDGTKYDGTKVFNGAAIGLRTISAENSSMEVGILLNEEDFKAGASIDLSTNSTSYVNIGGITALSTSGSIKVVSTSRIEIIAGIFYDVLNDNDITVTGYISSN